MYAAFGGHLVLPAPDFDRFWDCFWVPERIRFAMNIFFYEFHGFPRVKPLIFMFAESKHLEKKHARSTSGTSVCAGGDM